MVVILRYFRFASVKLKLGFNLPLSTLEMSKRSAVSIFNFPTCCYTLFKRHLTVALSDCSMLLSNTCMYPLMLVSGVFNSVNQLRILKTNLFNLFVDCHVFLGMS